MENIRSYEDMENYVRKVIDNSWDFVDKDPWGFIIFLLVYGWRKGSLPE